MKLQRIPFGLLPLLVLGACRDLSGESQAKSSIADQGRPASAVASDEVDDDDEGDQMVALSMLPPAAVAAALAEMPGFLLEEAELEGEGRYCLHGTVDGVFTEIEVTADGKVLDIEQDHDGDHNGDDDDDDDDDGDDDGDGDGDQGNDDE